jgi:hypothetical protein
MPNKTAIKNLANMFSLIILITFFLIPINLSATSINVAQPCTYESNLTGKDANKYPTLMKCDVWQEDGHTQRRITYKLSEPAMTPQKNCFVKQVEVNTSLFQALYAPIINGKCKSFKSGLYVSLIYVSDFHDKDEIFSYVIELKEELEKKGEYARAKLKTPFYKFWFCEECKEFLSAIESGNNVLIRSFNMNYKEPEMAQLAIKVNGERWLLSLERKYDEFFITNTYRTN